MCKAVGWRLTSALVLDCIIFRYNLDELEISVGGAIFCSV